MTISYSATGLTQTGTGTTISTSQPSAIGATTLTFSATTGVVNGMVISSPATLAGIVVSGTPTATVVSLSRALPVTVAGSTSVTFQDADGILVAGTGLTITDIGTNTGTNFNRQRLVNLSGSSTQFTVGGVYNIDTKQNTYAINSNSTFSGFRVASGGTLNISGTNTGYVTGTAISTGNKGIVATTQATAGDTVTGAIDIQGGGTVNMNGVSYWGNSGWSMQVSATTGGTLNVSNSSVRLGTAANGNSTLYIDGATGVHVLNFNNVYVNGYFKTLAISSTSTFNNVTWYKDTYQPVTNTSSDIAVAIAPNTSVDAGSVPTPNTDTIGFNLVGPRFGIAGNANSYYNTHLAMGAVSGRGTRSQRAVRSTVYGYELGVTPRVGKIYDFGGVNIHRPWIELRKNIALKVTDVNGNAVAATAANTYFEDSNQNTGALQLVNVLASGSGYGASTTFNVTVTQGGNTSGVITLTTNAAGGIVSGVVTTPGSAYTTTALNAITFTPTGGTGGSVQVWASQRYAAEANSGCTSPTANRFYIGRTTGNTGILNTTSTNSQNFGTTINNNPPIPTAGTILTGLDVMTGIANCSINGFPVNSFGLSPIDQRFSANGSPNWSVTIPVRAYGFAEGSTTVSTATLTTGEDIAQTVNRTLALPTDNFVGTTAEATALTYGDVTLVTTAPSRGVPSNGATQGSYTPVTSGTLTTGTTARTLDQIYAKAKADYVQPVLNESAGTIARTGFGIAPFLSASGTLTNATMSIGSWNISVGSGAVTTGSIFRTLSTTGNVNMYGGQITTPNATNAPSIVANNISLGSAGTPASWRTNSTLGAGTGASTFTASIPTGLGLSATVTTASVNITGTAATDQTNIQTALQNAVNSANINAQVAVTQVAGTQATVRINLIGAGASSAGTITFAPTNSNFSATFTKTSGTFSDALAVLTGLTTPAGWTKGTVSGASGFATTCSVTYTRVAGGPVFSGTVAATQTVSPTGNFFSSGATAGDSYGCVATDGVAGDNNLKATFTAPTPAAGGVVPTSALVLTSSLATYIVSTQAADQLVSSVAGFGGSTIYQSFTASGAVTGMPTSGLIMGSGGALLSGSASSNYNIMLGGIASNAVTFASGQDTIRTKNINATGGLRTLQLAAMDLYEGVLNVTTDSNNFNISMVGNTIGSNNLVINQIGGTGSVIVTTSGNTGGTITAGTGNVTIQSALVVTFDATSNGGTVGIYNGATLLTSAQLSAATFPASQLISYGGSATHVTFTRAATQIVDTIFPATGTLTLTGLASTAASDPSPALSNWSFLFNNTSIPGVYHGYLVVGADALSGFVTAQNVVALMGHLNFNKYIRFGVNQGYSITQLFSNTDNQTITLGTDLMRIQSDNPMTARQVYGITGDGVVITNVETQLVDRLVVGATTTTFPQVRDYPNSQATLGDVRQAVSQTVSPMFTKVDAGVVNASILVPYSGSTYP